jgi:hypothetical protein
LIVTKKQEGEKERRKRDQGEDKGNERRGRVRIKDDCTWMGKREERYHSVI